MKPDRNGAPFRLHAPIWLQILTLLLGGLVAAQAVTLALTVLLPPAPPQQHSLDEIAGALKGGPIAGSGRPLIRTTETAPPSLQSPGWVVSESSTAELVKLLGAEPRDVRLLFYAPPPLAGTDARPGRVLAPTADDRPARPLRLAGFITLAQAETPVGVGVPGDGPGVPGSALVQSLDGRFPGGATTPLLRRPGGLVRTGPGSGPTVGPGERLGERLGERQIAVPFGGFQPGPPSGRRATAGGDRGGPGPPMAGRARHEIPSLITAGPARGVMIGPGGPRTRLGPPARIGPGFVPRDPLEAAAFDSARFPPPAPAPQAALPAPAPPPEPPAFAPFPAQVAPPAALAPAPELAKPPAAPALALAPAPAVRAPALPVPAATVQAIPDRALSVPARPTVFGLARAPYVEGEFVAALRAADGRWTTVRPEPEAFPNSWQRRVLLWFGLALAVVAPLGYLFAHRLAAPLNDFAAAAERLGRDPSADLSPLTGPAEVGRAANAFNLMHRRLKRYVEDRTGMVGAISHDLRTPLARMRFKLERVPPNVRAALDRDITQMEEMIDQVLSFMRDEAAVGGRERVDLRSILECVVDEVDGAAELAPGASLEVEVDLLGVRRALENLVGNALKYGDRAEVRLLTRGGEAVVEIADHGPGLSDQELVEVFKPFYRSPAAKASGKSGMGLGLAVSRSTIRAHGGDLTLRRGEHGLIAEVRLPLLQAAAMAA